MNERPCSQHWIRRLLPIAIGLVAVACCFIGWSACTNASSPSTTATLTVALDGASCAGKTSNVDIFVDGAKIGTIQPGTSTSVTVSVGDHTVSASGSLGYNVPITTKTVGTAGLNLVLTC